MLTVATTRILEFVAASSSSILILVIQFFSFRFFLKPEEGKDGVNILQKERKEAFLFARNIYFFDGSFAYITNLLESLGNFCGSIHRALESTTVRSVVSVIHHSIVSVVAAQAPEECVEIDIETVLSVAIRSLLNCGS